MKTVVTFGEVMSRFTPHRFNRLRQAMPGDLSVTFGGAEANVAASISLLGQSARFVTALPDNAIGHACRAFLEGIPLDVSCIQMRANNRLGSYYLETGANQRASSVTYDRIPSALSTAPPDIWNWDRILAGADWFHTTGITPALSQYAADAALAGMRRARDLGCTVSLDLNFRGKLWNWGDGPHGRTLARKVVGAMMPYVDVVIANEQDADDVLDIKAERANVESGTIDAAAYQHVAEQIVARFPNVRKVAITLRESVSATHNRSGTMLYDATAAAAWFSPLRGDAYHPYEITAIVDRVGAGDSFGAALIVALRDNKLRADSQGSLDFAVAASALAHSVEGDINYVTRDEVEKLAAGNASGRVQR